jgi:hypothetical protein
MCRCLRLPRGISDVVEVAYASWCSFGLWLDRLLHCHNIRELALIIR